MKNRLSTLSLIATLTVGSNPTFGASAENNDKTAPTPQTEASDVRDSVRATIADQCEPTQMTPKETQELLKLRESKDAKINALREKKEKTIEALRSKKDKDIEALRARKEKLVQDYDSQRGKIEDDYETQKKATEDDFSKNSSAIEESYDKKEIDWQQKYEKTSALRKQRNKTTDDLRGKKDRELGATRAQRDAARDDFYSQKTKIEGTFHTQKQDAEDTYFKSKSPIEDAYFKNPLVQKLFSTYQAEAKKLECQLEKQLNETGKAQLDKINLNSSKDLGTLEERYSRKWDELNKRQGQALNQIQSDRDTALEQANLQYPDPAINLGERSKIHQESQKKQQSLIEKNSKEKTAFLRDKEEAFSFFYLLLESEKRALLKNPEFAK